MAHKRRWHYSIDSDYTPLCDGYRKNRITTLRDHVTCKRCLRKLKESGRPPE